MSPTAPADGAPAVKGYLHLIDTSRPWYKNRRLIILNLWIFLLLITSTANGYDGSMMNGLQLLTQWEDDFNHPSGSMLGLLGAIQNIGSLGAMPFTPYMADGIGRKKTVWFGATVMIMGAIIQTASQSVNMFIGARFMLGFGLGFATSGAPLLVMELAYPPQRGPISSVYNGLWSGGALIASWVTFGSFHLNSSWAWRLPSAFQALPSVFQFALILFGPESPRWLVAQGRDEEALEILAYYHANGNRNDPLIKFEFEEIKTAIEEEKLQNRASWLDLFKTRGGRRRMRIIIAIAFFSQWSGNGLTSYYLNQVFDTIGITNPVEQLLISGFLALWSLLLACTGGLLCDRVGRRPLFLLSTGGIFVFFLLQTVCTSQYAIHGNKAAGDAVVAFIYLYSAAYGLAYSPLITSYTIEILPFSLRAKGFTVFQFAVILSLIFNQYANPIALKAIGWKYYIVYVVWVAFEFVFIWFYLVETKNRTLEETAAIFDGEVKVSQIAGQAAAHSGLEGTPTLQQKQEEFEEKSDSKGSVEHHELAEA